MNRNESPEYLALKGQLRQMLFLLDRKEREIRLAAMMGFLLGGVVGFVIAQMMQKIL